MKPLAIIPILNEGKNLKKLIGGLKGFDILFIDDGSADETRDVLNNYSASVIYRGKKLGLGSAYKDGFKWGLLMGYEQFLTMDADLSHDPKVAKNLVDGLKENDVVVGTRYKDGKVSVVGWEMHRLILSKVANTYLTKTLGLKVSDVTGSFRAYRRSAIESVNLDSLSNGYSFIPELLYKLKKFKIGEYPITFYERASGVSKMQKRLILGNLLLPIKARLK